MNIRNVYVFLAALLFGFLPFNDADKKSALKIARTVRQAVRDADSTLLHASNLIAWRDYLKIAALDLDQQIQPLVLIEFDSDAAFRNQLKTLIAWERIYQKQETERYIYYHRPEEPVAPVICELQDAHCNELIKQFNFEPEEKIPYRYDPQVEAGRVFPFEDLRGGVVAPLPVDLHSGALAFFYQIDTAPAFVMQPLAQMYGTYFQNPGTSEAHFQVSMQQIQKLGYVEAEVLCGMQDIDPSDPRTWHSAFAFVYEMDRVFGPAALAGFIDGLDEHMLPTEMPAHFEATFDMQLSLFEDRFRVSETAKKF